MLGLIALALLGAEMALPKNKQTLIPHLMIRGQVIVLLVVIGCIVWCNVESEYFSGLIIQNDITQIMRAFFLVSSIVVCYLGQIYLSKQPLPKTEFYALVLIIAAAMMLYKVPILSCFSSPWKR